MKLEDHVAQDMMLFGISYEEVHRDLDKTVTLVGHPHRKDTHFLEYVLEKYMCGAWTVGMCRSAIQHIVDDCGMLMLCSDWRSGSDLLGEE